MFSWLRWLIALPTVRKLAGGAILVFALPGTVSDGLWWAGAVSRTWSVLLVVAGLFLLTVDLWWPLVHRSDPPDVAAKAKPAPAPPRPVVTTARPSGGSPSPSQVAATGERILGKPGSLKRRLNSALTDGKRLRSNIPHIGGIDFGLGLGGRPTTVEDIDRWQAHVESLLVSHKKLLDTFLYEPAPPRFSGLGLRMPDIDPYAGLRARMNRRMDQLELVIRRM